MSDLVPYVILGQWVDQEWIHAAANRNSDSPNREFNIQRYHQGPRPHPFGNAFVVIIDGKPRAYPSKAAALEDPDVRETLKKVDEAENAQQPLPDLHDEVE